MTAADPMSAALPAVSLPREAWTDRVFTMVGLALDAAVVDAMRRVVDLALMPSPSELPALRAAAAPFASGVLADDPRRFFAFLDGPLEVPEPTTTTQRRRDVGIVSSRRFASAYRPYGAAAAEPNDASLVEHWTHERRTPRATVLALHGFNMGTPRFDAWALFASAWFVRGLDVALLTLPYHGARTPPGARFSGQRFADPNPVTLH